MHTNSSKPQGTDKSPASGPAPFAEGWLRVLTAQSEKDLFINLSKVESIEPRSAGIAALDFGDDSIMLIKYEGSIDDLLRHRDIRPKRSDGVPPVRS